MRLTGLFVVASLLTFTAAAQDRATGERIVDRALKSGASWSTLEYLTTNIGPRLSGSTGAAAAVEWTSAHLRELGLEVRTEPIMVPHWVRGVEQAHLVSHHNQPVILTALGGSVATPPEGITADVLVVTSLEEATALGEKARGRIILYNKQLDVELTRQNRAFEAYGPVATIRSQGASIAAEQGAVAMLIRSIASTSLRTPHTGALRYAEDKPKIPAAAVTWEDAELINRLVTKGNTVRMHLVLTPQTLEDVPSANVVAEIKGTDKADEIVLVGGHLDSWDLGTGAIDNGSGVSMVMETMRILHELGIKPRRTIRGVLFMNEENGLRGGRGYFAAHKDEKHVAAIETDAGVARPMGFITTISDESRAKLAPHLALFNRIAELKLVYSKGTGADTSPLTDAGVPGYGFTPESQHYFDLHHTAADTLDKVNPEHLRQDSAAVALLTYILADMPDALK